MSTSSDGTAQDALDQVMAREYAGKYAASVKKMTFVGMRLSESQKGIVGMTLG